jgi:hypothetical protein
MKSYKYIFIALSIIIFASASSCTEVIPPYTPPGKDTTTTPTITIAEGITFAPTKPNADSSCVIYFKAAKTSALYGYTGDVYAHIGVVDGTTCRTGPDGLCRCRRRVKMSACGRRSRRRLQGLSSS